MTEPKHKIAGAHLVRTVVWVAYRGLPVCVVVRFFGATSRGIRRRKSNGFYVHEWLPGEGFVYVPVRENFIEVLFINNDDFWKAHFVVT